MSDDADDTTELYSVKDVSRLFALQEARLRYWHQTGFVGPTRKKQGRAYYTFADLVAVKAARELLDGGASLQKVRKLLDALKAKLPTDRALATLVVRASDDEVGVIEQGSTWQPIGETILAFEIGALAQEIADVLELTKPGARPKAVSLASIPELPPVRPVTPSASAYAAFLDGLRAEQDGDRALAEQLYRRAIAKDDGFSAAWTNLGNVLEAGNERKAARTAYDRALGLDPDQPEARYNLANLLSDDNELELALSEYRRVITSCPDFADACFNAALVCERMGLVEEMGVRLTRYLELDPESEWAGEARRMLSEIAPRAAAASPVLDASDAVEFSAPVAIEAEATAPADQR